MTAAVRPAPEEDTAPRPALLRSLGAMDGALITIGATVGSGIFLTTGDIARRLPHAGLILLLWLLGGGYALAGALTYSELGTMFPNSKLGMGECGTTNAAEQVPMIDRYYTMQINNPRFVGGYFWWYFYEQMVPMTKALWTTLNAAIASQPF